MGSPNRVRHRALVRRNGEKVHVIAHQAVGPNRQPVPRAIEGKVLQVSPTVSGGKEDPRAAVAAVGNVVREARHDNTCDARHLYLSLFGLGGWLLLSGDRSVQRPVLDGLGHIGRTDPVALGEIGYGARDLESTHQPADRKSEPLECGVEERLRGTL